MSPRPKQLELRQRVIASISNPRHPFHIRQVSGSRVVITQCQFLQPLHYALPPLEKKRGPRSKVDREAVIRDYKAGISLKVIAARHGIAYGQTISAYLRRWGVERDRTVHHDTQARAAA